MRSPPPYMQTSITANSRENTPEEQTETSSGIQLAHDADLLIRTYVPSTLSLDQPYSGPGLSLPICLPQAGVNPKEQSIFARGYNESLEEVGITQDVFLNFIDGLNMAVAASPPLRVVDMVGQVIGLVPYHWAMIAGIAMTVSARVAIRVLSKTLTDRYLRAANLNLFQPRGLSVRICTTPAMLALLSSSESPSQRSKLNKFGRGVGSVLLRLPIPVIHPIASQIIHAVADRPPPISPAGREGDPIKNPALHRRLAMTEGIALRLNVDNLPPPERPKGIVDRMASWGVKFDAAKEKNSEKNEERRRRALQRIKEVGLELPPDYQTLYPVSSSRLLIPDSSTDYPPSPPSSSKPFKRAASQVFRAFNEYRLKREIQHEEMEQQRRNASIQQLWGSRHTNTRVDRSILQRKTRMELKVADADLLEYWSTERLLWVVIMPSDKDAEISHIDIAEDPADEEQIGDSTWRAEMELERDELELDNIQQMRRRRSNVSLHSM